MHWQVWRALSFAKPANVRLFAPTQNKDHLMPLRQTSPQHPSHASLFSHRLGVWAQCVSVVALVALLGFSTSACDDDEANNGGEDTGATADTTNTDTTNTDSAEDTTTTPDTDSDGVNPNPVPRFAFGVDPAQTISAGPFPSNVYLGVDGLVDLAPIGDDPVVGTLGNADLLDIYDGHIAQREGFSYAAPALFFLDGVPAEASLGGKARIITLSGPEAGREVEAQVFWAPHTKAVGVLPAWGDYMMADSTYAVLLSAGITLEDGTALEPSEGLAALLSPDDPNGAAPEVTKARIVYAPLRAWMQDNAVTADGLLVATVFDTEPVVAYADRVFDAVDAFSLQPITTRVRYDEDAQTFVEATPAVGQAQLDALMGIPQAPFAFLPGNWDGSRNLASQVPEGNGSPYTGGSLHARIGAVYNGSIEAPAFNFTESGGALTNTALRFANGMADHDITALIPFTLYLCDDHLTDSTNLPVAVFSHGGGVTRLDALAMANLNCTSGIATAAIDMAFHGTRSAYTFLPTERLIAPTGADATNDYTGLSPTDPGYQPDFISEGLGATGSVGQLFGVSAGLDPLVVEANMLSVSADTHLFVRYIKEGDWSSIAPDLSFDPTKVFHQSLSFGTSLNTPALAMRDDFVGVVTSVGTGTVLQNIAMAPSNAVAASALAWSTLGLKNSSSPAELQAASYKDFMLGIHLWLHDRADPLGFAPYVLRHRDSAAPLSIISSGNSWDETLHNSVQLTYAAAFGLHAYHDGADWQIDPTVPGSERVNADLLSSGQTVTANTTYGSRTYTTANFFRDSACHPQLISNFCVQSFNHPYPPVTSRPDPIVEAGHLCELHHQIKAFSESLLSGSPLATVGVPSGDCASLYD